jgi:hypothetical protein
LKKQIAETIISDDTELEEETGQQQQQSQNADEKMDTTETQNTRDENYGVKRRSDSPSKGNLPKKRQQQSQAYIPNKKNEKLKEVAAKPMEKISKRDKQKISILRHKICTVSKN